MIVSLSMNGGRADDAAGIRTLRSVERHMGHGRGQDVAHVPVDHMLAHFRPVVQ